MTDKQKLYYKLNPHLGACDTCSKVAKHGTYCTLYGSMRHVQTFSPAKRARKYGVMCEYYEERK